MQKMAKISPVTFSFLPLNIKNINKHERFLIQRNTERQALKENFIVVNKILFQK